MSTTIIYNDETIATATNQSKLLKTAGTYMEGDVLVTDSTPTYNTQAKTGINPSTSSQTITPDSGYDGLSSVQINAMPTGTAGTPTATKGTVSNHSVSVTPSVTNTTGYITGSTKTGTAVTVSASELVSGTLSITSSGTKDVTNYASASVAAGSATASATKGTVSNHSVTVTPSVARTAGYITAGTATGTAVTVSASELVSGTKSITANGTGIDVTNYASVDVAVSSGATYTITVTNGTSTAFTYRYVEYNNIQYTTGSFTINSGDSIRIISDGMNQGDIYYDGSKVATANYNITPAGDLNIEYIYDDAYITLPTIAITQNGVYNVESYTRADVNVPTGGGGPAPKKQVNFIDYDGTILHSYTKTEWQSETALPSNPSHTGLTAQGWNWTKAQIDAQLTAMPGGDIWVGQMYITTSGDTEIDVSMPEGRLNPILTIAVNGTITVDWGDNTTADTVTGSSTTTRQAVSHTYAAAGDYMMKIHVTTGRFQFYGGTSYTLLRKDETANENKVYANCVRAVRFGSGVTSMGGNAFINCASLTSVTIPSSVTTMGTYAFSSCYSLASVTIPSDVTAVGTYTFYYCYSLASVAIPSGVIGMGTYAFSNCYALASVTIPSDVTSIGTYAFNSCYALASVTIPSGVTNINNNAFYYCYSLASITIPSGVTSIGTSAFNSCYALASITIPSDVTSIGNSAFTYCYGMAEYHIKPTTPPTIGSSTFSGIPSDCKIYVPSASLSTYQGASNWSTYASYMVGE